MADPLTRLEIKPPETRPQMNPPAVLQKTRGLSDEAKKIFEATSKDFATYANGGEKNNERELPPLINTPNSELDEWDKALLLGEYPLTAALKASVPQKSDMHQIGSILPSRIINDTIPFIKIPISPFLDLPKSTPSSDADKTTPFPTIPQKPKNIPSENTDKKIITPPILIIPLRPKQPGTNTAPTNSPRVNIATADSVPVAPLTQPIDMSELLIGKIIDGQMKIIFKDAPMLVQKKLEETPVQEIIAETEQGTQEASPENEIWEKKLYEHLLKLREEATAISFNADPREGETTLTYIKRVYPALMKARAARS